MPDYDEQYFQTLLQESRTECLEYQLPRKEEILEILKTHENVFKERDAAEKRKNQLKKKKAPEEEIQAAHQEWKSLKQQSQKMQDISMNALIPILTNDIHLEKEPERLHFNLLKCSIITQQGPKEMAAFCQENGNEIADELLGNYDVMKEMLLNGGANHGKFLEAYKLFDELMQLMEEDPSLLSDSHRRLAMGTALQLAVPRSIFGEKTLKVDPKTRFLHYAQAHNNGELDPSFPYFTAWEYRHVVDCDSTDEELQWGRDQLKRYYPDHLSHEKPNWVYSSEIQTDVAYQKPQWGEGQQNFRKLMSVGGKCGPRAWMGRFLCKAFGVPTWGVKQSGHAAVARWTPQIGWETCLGGSLTASWWDNRAGDDFKFEAHARHFQKDLETYFTKVTLLECMAEAHQEKSIHGDHMILSPDSLWNSLVRAQLRFWFKKAKGMTKKGVFERGPKDADEPEGCAIRSFFLRTDDPASDNKIEANEEQVRVPACALVNCEGVSMVRCFEGGGQVHFPKGTPGTIEFKLPPSIPKDQYDLAFKICTLHAEQESDLLCVSVNDSREYEVPVLYTVGEWAFTNPVKIEIGGEDVLKITRKSGKGTFWGITMREFVLKKASQ